MNVLCVEFDRKTYTLFSLQSSLYRMIGVCVGKIRETDKLYICDLSIIDKNISNDEAETMFLEYVSDESLRERLNIQTEPLRNVILSLAFGAMAVEKNVN